MAVHISSESQIISEIGQYIRNHGGSYPQWYVGIASDAERRLFGDHSISRTGDLWIYRRAVSDDVARRVETHFLSLGCDGGVGGGDHFTVYVYAYRKSWRTNP